MHFTHCHWHVDANVKTYNSLWWNNTFGLACLKYSELCQNTIEKSHNNHCKSACMKLHIDELFKWNKCWVTLKKTLYQTSGGLHTCTTKPLRNWHYAGIKLIWGILFTPLWILKKNPAYHKIISTCVLLTIVLSQDVEWC